MDIHFGSKDNVFWEKNRNCGSFYLREKREKMEMPFQRPLKNHPEYSPSNRTIPKSL